MSVTAVGFKYRPYLRADTHIMVPLEILSPRNRERHRLAELQD